MDGDHGGTGRPAAGRDLADISIGAARGAVADLEEHFAPRWADLYDGEKDDFAIEWSNDMAHLRGVERLHAAGGLTAAQEREYAPVRRLVAELLPTIKRLELAEPGIPLG